MRVPMPYAALVATSLFVLPACGSRVGLSDIDPDAGDDAAVDAGVDAAVDATGDAGRDVGVDTTPDTAPDAAPDAGCTELAVRCWPWPDGTDDEAYGPGVAIAPLTTVACAAFTPEGVRAPGSLTLAQWPEGSTTSFAAPLPDGGAPIFLDVVGAYRVDVALDEPGMACPLATAQLNVEPSEALYVELTWSTPGDPDETDEGPGAGSDLSLHLLHPNGCWFDPAWDVFDPAQSVVWGDPDDPADDGRLVQRDDNGGGPEVAVLEVDDGTTFSVGVAFVDDHGFGTARATVRIYEQAALARELSLVLDPGDLWAAMSRSRDGEWNGDRIVGSLDDPPPCP